MFPRWRIAAQESSMHTPTPQSDPERERRDDDMPQPPVPPDRQEEIVPVEEPPKPGRGDAPPMIAALNANPRRVNPWHDTRRTSG